MGNKLHLFEEISLLQCRPDEMKLLQITKNRCQNHVSGRESEEVGQRTAHRLFMVSCFPSYRLSRLFRCVVLRHYTFKEQGKLL